VLRRRLVVAVLVLVSLALLTVYFRESSGGGLHSLQSTGASVLNPFEVAANRVAQPFRDAASWFGGLSTTRDQNRKLRAENKKLKAQLYNYDDLQRENADLRRMLRYAGGPSVPQTYSPVSTSILASIEKGICRSGLSRFLPDCQPMPRSPPAGAGLRHFSVSRPKMFAHSSN